MAVDQTEVPSPPSPKLLSPPSAGEKPADISKTPARSRLIVRLGALLVSNSTLVSVLCCIAGIVALVFLLALTKNTYISENALMPGSANPLFSFHDVADANKFILDLSEAANKNAREVQELIAKYMKNIGSEVYHQKFPPHIKSFQPLHFFCYAANGKHQIPPNRTQDPLFGTNTVGIIRAPRGDRKESIVLVTPYNPQSTGPVDFASLGLALSVFSLLSRATWLAKDFIWLASDSQYGEYASVSAWLNEYQNPNFARNYENRFKRAGTLAAAIVLKIVEERDDGYYNKDRDTLTMYAEASNGQMPNLDLLNIVHYLAVRQGLRVNVPRARFLLNNGLVRVMGEIMERLGVVLKRLNPNWKLDVTKSEFVEGMATLASSMYFQALGVPTGPHGAFRDYQIDSVTLHLSPRFNIGNENARSAFLLRGGRMIEGVFRSVNNLLEKFHQSFFLYFLTAPNKFISVGVYMIPFLLLITPLPIHAASLFNSIQNHKPYNWLQAVKSFLLIQSWSVLVSLLPSQITDMPSGTSMLIWVGISSLSLVISYLTFGSPYSRDVEWRQLKAVMIASVTIGLGLMSIINFATAQFGALLVVPMCLLARPFRDKMEINVLIQGLIVSSNVGLIVLGFPVTGVLIGRGSYKGFGEVRIGDFWECMEFLWGWNSATYLYLMQVQLPCWILFVHILSHQQ